MSLNVQAAMGPVRPPERSQFSQLMRHFLERFFNHETASPDGDAKARMVTIACAAGLPGFVVALYLWPVYHPVIVYPPHPNTPPGPPPYWLQVNHHFFFVLYSFVAMGLAVVYEWDLFFPDLLDIFVLGTLPITERRKFAARIASIAILLMGFIFDTNMLAPITLVIATDPPDAMRFLTGHIFAVTCSGFFAAAFLLAMQSVLLSLLGERLFRRISLVLQGLIVAILVVLLLLFPVLSGVTPALLQSGNVLVLCFPPFWFLGIYQWLLEGPAVMPVYVTLAKIGCIATLTAAMVAITFYPLAYTRRVRQLIEGANVRRVKIKALTPLLKLLHGTIVRSTVGRAAFHFIGQTLLRVPRYRIYFVLYGGVGLSIMVATILRLTTIHEQVHAEISADGIRAAVGIMAFWVIAGLRTAFVSSGNLSGGWIWRIVHGSPPQFDAALKLTSATKNWVVLYGSTITLATVGILYIVAPPEMQNWLTVTGLLLVSVGMCLLLTDIFFLNVMSVPLTGEATQKQENLAFTLLRYFTFFPLVTSLSLFANLWIEGSALHLGATAAVILVAHFWLSRWHNDLVRINSDQLAFDESEEDFPTRLGLLY